MHRDAILRRGDNNAWQPFASTYLRIYRWGAYVAALRTPNNNYRRSREHSFIMGYDDDDDDDDLYTQEKVNTLSGCDLLVYGVTIAAIHTHTH